MDRIEAIRHEGKLLNFGENVVNIECVVDSNNYEVKEIQLPLIKDSTGPHYECDYNLKLSNRRKAFRTRAAFKAVLTNKISRVADDVTVYDMSTSGLGLLVPEDYYIEVGTPVGVGIFVTSAKGTKPELIRLEGEVARCQESELRGKAIVGVKLEERSKPAGYDKLVFEEQVRFRNGRNNT